MLIPNPLPGGIDNPLGNEPIKTYPINLERDIGNIIGRNSVKTTDENRETVWIIKDMDFLIVDLLEYIINKNGKPQPTASTQ